MPEPMALRAGAPSLDEAVRRYPSRADRIVYSMERL
jgi:hypothetical protein